MIFKQACTYVADDSDEGEDVEDIVPRTDVLRPGGRRSLVELDELVGVETQFDDVVDEGTKRRQRKRSHEDRHETELDHCVRRTSLSSSSSSSASL